MVIPPFNHQHQEAQSRDGAPQFHIRALQRRGGHFGVLAELSQSTAFSMNMGNEIRYGQRLCNVSNPIQMIRCRPNSPARMSDACAESTSDTAQLGVLTAKLSAIGTLSKPM